MLNSFQHLLFQEPKLSIPLNDQNLPIEAGGGKPFSFRVSEKDLGKRLDQFLSAVDINLSRSQAKKLIEEEVILLNGKPAKPSTHLKMGDQVSGTLPAPAPLLLEPEPIPLTVLHEDPSIIVIDKPPGMVVHPAYGNPSGTLVNALLHHCKDLHGINGFLRPGIVHRIDKDTSGVMVVAKDDQAYQQLTRQFKNRTVEKIYLAIAYGKFTNEEGLIDLAIGRHPTERKRMSTRTARGRPAITRWKVLERLNGLTLLEIFPQTGRTHQIRVHLSTMGHPLLGDPLYGRKGRPGTIHDPLLKACVERMGRQALHAHRLGFSHPRTGGKSGICFTDTPGYERSVGMLTVTRKNILNRSALKIKDDLPYFGIPELAEIGWLRHGFLTRKGGVSPPPYDSLNLGENNGDQADHVYKNKQLIAAAFEFNPAHFVLLKQIHQDRILVLRERTDPLLPFSGYDAVITGASNAFLSIRTADCLPVFLVDVKRKVIAAIHAGRQGTGLHISPKVLKKMKEEFFSSPGDLLIALGPSIGPCCYEIDEKVFQPEWEPYSTPRGEGRWMVDLARITIAQMKEEGIREEQILWIDLCTHCHNDLFFSYRREAQTGRQVSFIGIADD